MRPPALLSTAIIVFICAVALAFMLPTSMPAAAQRQTQPTTCAVNLPQHITRAVRACRDLERNTACRGNGRVFIGVTAAADDPNTVFANSGDQLPIESLTFIQTSDKPLDATTWGIARMEVQANLLAEQPARSSTLWLLGAALVENRVPPPVEIIATSTGTLNLRTLPQPDAPIIDKLGLRDYVIANGRTDDNRWLRVFVPRQQTLAWASTEVAKLEGDINTLEVVTPETPFYRPFQIIDLTTGSADSPCDDVPDSGVLIQTPNEFSAVEFIVNDVVLLLTGTVFLQTDAEGETLTVNTLNGAAFVESGEAAQTVPAGTRVVVDDTPGEVEAYALDDLDALPIDALPYTFALLLPLTEEQIFVALNPTPEPTPAEPDPDQSPRCVRTLTRDSNVRQGPGDFYEVLTTWEEGTKIRAVYAQTDGDGYTWWQVYTGAWVRADYVTSTGDCDEVATTTITTGGVRSNTLTLESCYTGNGPIRSGQQVTVSFLDGGWESYGEANQALNVAPARINVGSTRLHVYASEPFLVSSEPERWYIKFTAGWTARPGTFRIVGSRRFLELRCNITVPFGR